MNREETKKHFKSWCQGHIGNNASDEDYHMFNNIMALLEQEPTLHKIFCTVHPLSIMSTPELEHKAIMQIAEMLEPLYLPESDIEKRKPCINNEDGCEEWAGCPCVHFKGRK